jgi:hypothetical protein
MFDEKKKLERFPGAFSGLDIHHISTSSDYYRARPIEEMDRNMAFLQFTTIRNRGEMIFVTESVKEVTMTLMRAISEKWVIPILHFQLGYYPDLQAEVSHGKYYLLDKFSFMDSAVTRVWPHTKIYADDGSLTDIVHVTFADSSAIDYGDTEHPIS